MKYNIQGLKQVLLPWDPIKDNEAATKRYVDENLGAHTSDTSLHLGAGQRAFLDALTVTAAELNNLAGLNGNVVTEINSKVAKAGDTMTGALVLSGAPTQSLHATTKDYVDTGLALKLNLNGGTLTGALVLAGAPTELLHPATKAYVDTGLSAHTTDNTIHVTSSQRTFLDNIVVSATEINYLNNVTSNVQEQLDAKLDKSGGTMTGSLKLAADPSIDTEAATKKYVDDKDAVKLDKAGGTMTGTLVLSGAPANDLEAATKKYVDDGVSTHASNDSLHLTPGQNTWIDAITVSAAEVNELDGITSNVQAQIDTKFDKAGGTVTGDIILAVGKAVFVSKSPESGTELVNKAYVDAMVNGHKWRDPILASNLITLGTVTDPSSLTPAKGDTHIIAADAVGDWVGKDGWAATWNGTSWSYLLSRAVAVDDRFGVNFNDVATVDANLTSADQKIITITDVTNGVYTFDVDPTQPGSAVLVFDDNSTDFGVSYSLLDEGYWTPTNASVNFVAGSALEMDGNILNVVAGAGLDIVNDKVLVKLNGNEGGLGTNGAGQLEIVTADGSLVKGADGIKLKTEYKETIEDAVTKTGTSSFTGILTVTSSGTLRTQATPSDDTDVINKKYADDINDALASDITALQTTVGTLNTDPVTKTYVDNGLNTKLDLAGGTMTGDLTLKGAPSSNNHAANKKYVDDSISSHADDDSIHITSSQNAWLDSISATATEVNYLGGLTSNAQSQLDAKLALAGGTMTGDLTLKGDPTLTNHAATKNYVDTKAADYLPLAGGTMSGVLVLSGAPSANLEATTKKYVDDGLSNHANDKDLHLTGAQNLWIDAITATATEVNALNGVTSSVQDQLNSMVPKAGTAMTGLLTLSGAPVNDMHAATKLYADTQDATKLSLSGGVMTGDLTLKGDPSSNNHAATKAYVDAQLTNSASTKVDKAGDTMTGRLTLSADPVDNLHAATKKYVDDKATAVTNDLEGQLTTTNGRVTTLEGKVAVLEDDPVTKQYVDDQDGTKLNKSGGVMTGFLTLYADPTSNLHAVTKQYVDTVAQGLETKPSVRFATTGNISATYNNGASGVNSTLTGTVNGAIQVDGGTPVNGDRILVKDQTNKLENGDYYVQQTGDASTPFILKRITTLDESTEIPGSYFWVTDGLTMKNTGWTFVVDDPSTFVIGTHDIYVNQFAGAGNITAGDGLTITGNVLNVHTANSGRIVVNADNIDLAVTGVVAGEYTKVVVDAYGRVTDGSNPTTLAGYGITDAQDKNAKLTSLSGTTDTGIIVSNAAGTVAARELSADGVGISITNGKGIDAANIVVNSNATPSNVVSTLVSRDSSGNFSAGIISAALSGNASTATTLQTSRNFSITGDIVASAVSFNGSVNVELNGALTATGVTAGQYTKLTVDSKGRVTDATNLIADDIPSLSWSKITSGTPTTVAGYGITDAYTKTEVDAKVEALENALNELHAYVMARI